MKVYISGQISNMDYQAAFNLFEIAEDHLAKLGYTPVNPMKSEGEVPGRKWAEYIAEDILILDECDAIYMLPNWRNSNGAKPEQNRDHARAAGRGGRPKSLSRNQAIKARQMKAARFKLKEIAGAIGVKQHTLYGTLYGKTWSELI